MPAPPLPAPETASDAELLAAIADGDKAAFAVLFSRYAGKIKGFMMRSRADAADADEIVQDVMVAIWRRASSFDPARAGAATWIFAIARNRRIDLIRRASRPAPDPEDPLYQPDPEPDGLASLSRAEDEERVRTALATLAPEQRAVLVAAFYDGLSQSEIALAQNLPLGTVKSRFRLAFRHLRGVLGEELAPEEDDG